MILCVNFTKDFLLTFWMNIYHKDFSTVQKIAWKIRFYFILFFGTEIEIVELQAFTILSTIFPFPTSKEPIHG